MSSGVVLGAMTKLVTAGHLIDFNEPLDPGFVAYDPARGPNPLQRALDAIVEPDAGLKRHAYAVVDLTVDPLQPVYAGWNDAQQREIASLAKLLPLYGAFELRANLRQLSSALSISDLATLAKAARAHYRRMGAVTGKLASIELPWIEELFRVGTAGNVAFRIDPILTTDGQLDSEYLDPRGHVRLDRTAPCVERNADGSCKRRVGLLSEPQRLKQELDQISAREQLRLMAGWSDDVAAAVVSQSLGFSFLWALSNGKGLYRRSGWDPPLTPRDVGPSPRSGLFLKRDYNHAGLHPPKDVPDGPTHGGNARSLAVLMTMLAQGRLVDAASDAEIREMLRRPSDFGFGERAEKIAIGLGMKAAGWAPAQPDWQSYDPASIPGAQTELATAKIGWEPPKNISNALLVRTRRSSTTITAVLVALKNDNDSDAPLRTFGEKIANALDILHP